MTVDGNNPTVMGGTRHLDSPLCKRQSRGGPNVDARCHSEDRVADLVP